ncbi:MAG: Coenzyme F420 hydrogenase/dehydrogenase, beta subunit C-terminal domain [Candidatus Thioglobus sp.]|jgi:coenzyme F420 hydrogenase subunit beta|nr:Coenzyme F420 hydrogenase/dehydrogenase, beta subunit C-terminal domain [Candidatus Thioglobus sp.]
MNKSANDRMNSISEQGLCSGCGICQSIAGPNKIKVVKSMNGFERPIIIDDLDDATVDRIFEICPGTRIEGLPENKITHETKTDNVWGSWLRIVRAWAGNPKIRFEGSTGGVLTALAQFLLYDQRVDFILHVKASNKEPTFGKRYLSFTEADVLEGVGSRYGPAAPLIDIDEVLARGRPFAFIGKPCDIAALRNLARHDERVDELVKYWLSPVCGGFMSPSSTDNFLSRSGVIRNNLISLRYRGQGCPGPMQVKTFDEEKMLHYLDYWGDDESTWNLPFRCKICPDGIGEAADIAASDTWIGGSPTRNGSKTDLGTNAVVVRTASGLELLEAAAKSGAINIEYDITPDDMSLYQPHQMHKKYAAYDRHQGMGDEGRIVPKTRRLRLEELANEMQKSTRKIQRDGTSSRVRSGKATEPKPIASK